MQSDKQKQAFKNSSPVLIVKGFWLFMEGAGQLGMALFAIYQARYGHYPIWSKYALTIAGVLVLIPAAILLSKFFRNVGKA